MRKQIFILAAIATVMFAAVSCKKDQQQVDRSLTAGILAVLHIPTDAQGRIVPNAPGNVLNLTSTDTWLLDSVTRVPSGYTLNIPAGTVIQTGTARTYTVTNPLDPSDIQTRDIAGVLVVERGGTLNANGTSGAPVVFTTAGATTPGAFGGVVILGNAPTNKPTTTEIEGLPDAPTPGGNQYGGSSPNDNSGSLTYVRIEYPGIRLFDNQEVNGLTLGGVGKCTKLEHIEVLYSADDAFEWFGGTVNAKYLLAVGSDDDDFDFDFGYTGTIQFAIGLKNPATTNSTSSGSSDSNGIESDNDASGSTDIPFTRPVLSNFTLLGYNQNTLALTKLEKAAHFRRNSRYAISNSILGGFPTGVHFETGNSGTFVNNLVHGFTNEALPTPPGLPPGNFGIPGIPSNPANATTLLTSAAAYFLNPPPAYVTGNLAPSGSSDAFGNADFPSGSLWDISVNYGSSSCPFNLTSTANLGAIDAAAIWNFGTGWAVFPAY